MQRSLGPLQAEILSNLNNILCYYCTFERKSLGGVLKYLDAKQFVGNSPGPQSSPHNFRFDFHCLRVFKINFQNLEARFK